MFHVPQDQVTHQMRSRAKAVNFGIVYGISAFSLSQDIGVTVQEAKEYMDRYFATYTGVKQYMTDVVGKAREQGYVETLWHRRRALPELKSSNFNMRSFGERVALNMPIQGTAADIIKLAMVRVHSRLAREGLAARLIMQVHDELIVECPEEEREQVERGGPFAAGDAGRGGAVRSPAGGGPHRPQLAGRQGLILRNETIKEQIP